MAKEYKKIIAAILTPVLWMSFAVAAETKLPEVMVGQTMVEGSSTMGSINVTSGGYVEADNIPTLGANPFTVMAWIKPTDRNETYQSIISMGKSFTQVGLPGAGWGMGIRKGGNNTYQIQVTVGNTSSGGSGYSQPNVFAAGTLFDGNWHHVAFSYNPTNGGIDTLFDNNFSTYKSLDSGITGSIANTSKINIGKMNGMNVNAATGLIDEVRIYDNIAMDINSFNNFGDINNAETNDLHPTNLIARWQFSEGVGGVGTITVDSTGGSHDGTLKPGVTWGPNIYSVRSKYYGGYTGNEVVYNSMPSGKTTGKSLSPSPVFNGLRNANGGTRNPVPAFSYVDGGTGSAITGEGAFSVSVWVKRDRTTPPQFDPNSWGNTNLNDPPIGQDSIMPRDFIISQGQGMWGDYYIYFNKYDQVVLRTWGYGRDRDGVDRGGSGEGLGLSSGSTKIPYNDKNWHHIVVVRDAGGLSGKMWVDGNDVTSYVCPSSNPACPGGVAKYIRLGGGQTGDYLKTVIGALSWGWGTSTNTPYPFKGNISSVRIYDRALVETAANPEISNLYKETNVPTNNLKAYWKLNEGSGTVAADSSGNNSTASYNNTNWTDDGPLIPDTNVDELFGFNKDLLYECASNGMLADPDKCFRRNTSGPNSVTVASSRSYVNGTAATETAVLFYPSKTVMGDVYGSLNNFAFWGRNLHHAGGTAGSDASWTMDNYPMNENAQAKWDGDEFKKNSSKIATLKGEAPSANSDTGSRADWYLQTPTGTLATTQLSGNTTAEISKYPEGKVWRINGSGVANNLIISSDIKYHGTGTIVVDGNLTINSGVDISPYTSGTNRLGFIVLGTVTILGNNNIQASIYCPNMITVSAGNVVLTGSFVANEFEINAANARFYYDYALDSAWPPGFRYLNMPHPTETKQ